MSPEAAKKYVLAIDHGTSGVKTSLMSMRGELVDCEFEATPIRFLPGGGAEQDPEDWWRALVNTSKTIMGRAHVSAEDVEAVCVSSTFSSTVAVGEDNMHLTNSLTWMDSRGAPYIKRMVSGFPEIDGYSVFTMIPWIRKTAGGPQLSGKDDIAHVLWWKNQKPQIYNRAKVFLGSKDYLNLRLTGEVKASHDSMTLFWLTNTRDINNPAYDDGLIKRTGIDRGKLPPMVRSVDMIGEVMPEVAKEMGLPPGVKVAAGSPDHQSACIGSGAVRDFEAHLYIGTSSWIQCVVPFKKTDMFRSIASLPTSIPGKYYAANEQDIAGGALSFLSQNILFNECGLGTGAPPDDVYERMDKIAAQVPPGSGGVIVTPWLNGERTPVDDTTLRAGIHNISLTTTSEHLARAFMEGVALNTKWALKYVERFCARRLDPITIVGGGARSDVWCGIFADVLNRNVRQVEDPLQTNARGAAFIAAVAAGHISWDDIPGLVKIRKEYRPDPTQKLLYRELFKEFVAIYKNNRAMYRRLNSPRR